jgi:uncharacterized membrane protein
LKFLYKYFLHIGLTVALELLLAADIPDTAIAPTWDEIEKLAAIASLRPP